MARSEFHGPRAVHVTQEEVRRFCEFLYRRTGMSFSDSKRYYIDRRLAERIAATNSPSFQAYFAMLRSDADHEIEYLINACTVNETYFYREDHQLRCMTSDLLDDLIRRKQPGEPIRIWSIPCSTGEEPYLIDPQIMSRFRGFDIVFCRNVLIYFDDASRRIAAESLFDCLNPGGYICLGHSETMSRISPLYRVCRFSDAIVYQRPKADHVRI
jgi:chemotaxis protein methyltransferase CheR